jgi:uncharacterized delta-60 repeat protein
VSWLVQRILLAPLVVLLLAVAPQAAGAAGGARDPSFDGSGLVNVWGLSSGFVYPVARAAVVQPDGKIIVAGQIDNPATSQYEFAVVRLNPDGSYDGTFGDGGMVTFAIPGVGEQWAEAVQLLPDGSIIVAGQTVAGVGVLKLTPSGEPDASFGSGGALIAPGPAGFNRLAISEGDVVLLDGANAFASGSLVRLTATGALDTAFGGTGIVPVDFPTSGSTSGLIAGPGGTVVVGGYDDPNEHGFNFALARYTASGVLDTAFGKGGIVEVNEGYTDAANQPSVNTIADLAAGPGGSIIAWGRIYWEGIRKIGELEGFGPVPHEGTGNLLVQFNASGTQISKVLVATEDHVASRVAVAPDGSVYGLETSISPIDGEEEDYSSGIVRFSTPSTIDSGFGVGGVVSANFGTNLNPATGSVDNPLDVTAQPNGQPIIVGIDAEPRPAIPRGEAMRLLVGEAPGGATGGATGSSTGATIVSGSVASTGSGGSSTPAPGTASVGHVSVSGTTASMPITCHDVSGASCTITAALSVVETLQGNKVVGISAATRSAKRRRATVVLGSATAVVSAGQTKTVRIALNGAGRRLLTTRHSLAAKITISSAGHAVTTSAVTFKIPPRRTTSGRH